jgi:hypothetical protein
VCTENEVRTYWLLARGLSKFLADPAAYSQTPTMHQPARSVTAWYGSHLRRCIFAQIEQCLVHIAPAPSFGRIISLYDGMPGSPEMRARMFTGRLVAAAHVTTRSAYPQMKPGTAGF